MSATMGTLAVIGRRACSALAVTSAVLHVVMAASGATAAMAVLAVSMAIVCCGCARHLWRSGDIRAWCGIALMNLAMFAVHLSFGGCHQIAPVAAAGSDSSPMMSAATGVAGVEAVIGLIVVFVRTRRPVDVRAGQGVVAVG